MSAPKTTRLSRIAPQEGSYGDRSGEMPCRRIQAGMMIRRTVAASIVAMLLSVPALAAACDVSCAFASMNSDCHSRQTETLLSTSAGVDMDDMAMAGMAMPEMAGSANQQGISVLSPARAAHASIGEMGPCERKACDDDPAVSARSARSDSSHYYTFFATTEAPLADRELASFHGTRHIITMHQVCNGSLLQPNLRI
jgi:hypothetical protein